MKKFIMAVVGGLLFLAGYNYTRRQAEYAATQSTIVKPVQAKMPVMLPFKSLPTLIFRSDKSTFS